MAAKMHVFLLSRDHLNHISEKRRGASQFVRTVVFAVFHQLSFNVTQVKSNHQRFFPYKVENCYIATIRLHVTNREPTCVCGQLMLFGTASGQVHDWWERYHNDLANISQLHPSMNA
jgi:hypothetical protein